MSLRNRPGSYALVKLVGLDRTSVLTSICFNIGPSEGRAENERHVADVELTREARGDAVTLHQSNSGDRVFAPFASYVSLISCAKLEKPGGQIWRGIIDSRAMIWQEFSLLLGLFRS